MNENANTSVVEGSTQGAATGRKVNELGQRLIRTPWAFAGADISTCESVDDAIEKSGLGWQVEMKDVFIPGKAEVDGIPVIGRQVAGIQAICRVDSGKIVGSSGRGYTPIQNHDMFSVFNGIVETGSATFDRSGGLASNHYGQGSRVFFSARMKDSTDIGNDKIHTFIYGKSGHDGGQSYVVSILDYVEICSNGMVGMNKINSVSIRHTANAKDRIDQARSLLGFAEQHQVWLNQVCDGLFSASMNTSEMTEFVEQLLPPTLDGEGKLRVSGRLKNKREKIVTLFKEGIGQSDRKDTKWAAMNAVTEFVDHTTKYSSRLKDDETARHDSCLEGSGASLKDRALELLTA